MPTYITHNTLGDDSIRILLSDPIVVGLCSRDDFPQLSEIEEVHRPGIYILMDEHGKRYVGQATGGVHGRLNSHDKAKDWWTNLVFIAHAYGALSPDKLNYLEAKLIADFSRLGYVMDNGNGGNRNSYIGTPQKLEAEKFLQDALEGLRTVAHVDLYQPVRKTRVRQLAPPRSLAPDESGLSKQQKAFGIQRFTPPFTIEDNEGRKFVGDDFIGADDSIYVQWMLSLTEDAKRAEELLDYFTAAWVVQSESDPHRNEVPTRYVAGGHGVYVHPPSKGYPANAARDLKAVSDHFGLSLTLKDSKGLNLLDEVSVGQRKKKTPPSPRCTYVLTDSLGNRYEGKGLSGRPYSGGGVYGEWLKKLAADPERRAKLFEFAHSSTNRQLKVSEIDPSPEGRSFYLKIADKLWAYTTLSKSNALQFIQEAGRHLGITVTVEEVPE